MLESINWQYIIEISNEIIEVGDDTTQIGVIIDTVNGIIDTVKGIKDTVKGIKDTTLNGIKDAVNSIKCIANYIIGTIVLCLPDAPFTGPGGKSILNENKPFLGPGEKSILNETTKSEQTTKLEQKAKEKEKDNKETLIILKIAKPTGAQVLRQGQQSATIMYEKIDRDSRAIVTLSNPAPNDVAIGLYGEPRVRRTGIHLDKLSPFGTYIAPESVSWRVNGVWHNGIVCTALRQPGIKFVDGAGMDIPYNGNEMLVPYSDRRRVI